MYVITCDAGAHFKQFDDHGKILTTTDPREALTFPKIIPGRPTLERVRSVDSSTEWYIKWISSLSLHTS